jgi:hypothetical protein
VKRKPLSEQERWSRIAYVLQLPQQKPRREPLSEQKRWSRIGYVLQLKSNKKMK